MNEYIDKIKKFVAEQFKDRKAGATFLGIVVLIVLAAGYIGYQIFQPNVTTSELDGMMTESINYLEQAKTLKLGRIANEVSAEEFNTRASTIEEGAARVNQTIHESEFSENVKIDKQTLYATGDALEGLIAVIFNSPNLNNIQDEILALQIILEDMKDGNIEG